MQIRLITKNCQTKYALMFLRLNHYKIVFCALHDKVVHNIRAHILFRGPRHYKALSLLKTIHHPTKCHSGRSPEPGNNS